MLLITLHCVQGHMAMWVCRQSPYQSLGGVEVINAVLHEKAATEWTEGVPSLLMRRFESWRDLENWLHSALDGHEQMTAWNTPKIDTGAPFMFTSRYDTPTPEYDFIDLDALLRNVARTSWAEMQKDDDFDKKFEAGLANASVIQ